MWSSKLSKKKLDLLRSTTHKPTCVLSCRLLGDEGFSWIHKKEFWSLEYHDNVSSEKAQFLHRLRTFLSNWEELLKDEIFSSAEMICKWLKISKISRQYENRNFLSQYGLIFLCFYWLENNSYFKKFKLLWPNKKFNFQNLFKILLRKLNSRACSEICYLSTFSHF